ncbi:MAG TPA: ATP-binding protein, partial [Roseiflexaceae bacterium]|nr:ATP-binding protein [Roseiflexaceae bacterium]
LLGAGGPGLSRRTAYRILSEIRAGRQNDAERVVALLRSALPMLLEDPPLALGTSPLAQQLLPAHSDPLRRGLLVQHALRQALARLRPAGPVSSLERPWWPYLICSGEYEAGQSRAELQAQLALSVSTYTRAKRHGLERISALVPALVEHLLATPTVQAAQRLPRTPGFVGRRDEQAYYTWRLQTEGYAALWGIPGCGKTALAAELAADGQRYGQTVLWHTCLPGADATLTGILESFGRAIAGMGDTALWNILRNEQAQATPTDMLETLRQHLSRQPALIIIDNLDHAELPGCQPVFELLHALVRTGSARLLTISRQQPATEAWPPLSGLTEADARLLWGNGLPLPP